MANGKEASGLVPRVAWESWALSQLALGPGKSSARSCLATVPQCHDAEPLSKPRRPMGLQASNIGGLDPGLFFLGHVVGPCTRVLLPKLRPHTQKLRCGKSSGKKIPSCSQNITRLLQRASLADLQLCEHRFGRIRAKLSSNRTQSLKLTLQL